MRPDILGVLFERLAETGGRFWLGVAEAWREGADLDNEFALGSGVVAASRRCF